MIVFCCVLPASNKARDDDEQAYASLSSKRGKSKNVFPLGRGPRFGRSTRARTIALMQPCPPHAGRRGHGHIDEQFHPSVRLSVCMRHHEYLYCAYYTMNAFTSFCIYQFIIFVYLFKSDQKDPYQLEKHTHFTATYTVHTQVHRQLFPNYKQQNELTTHELHKLVLVILVCFITFSFITPG